MDLSADPIVVEQTYQARVEVVWMAITDKDQMRQWFFEAMTDFDPVPGFETEFIVKVDDQEYPHQWKVTEVVPGKSITYDWRYGGFPGQSSVEWELSETPNGTNLRLTHQVQQAFPQDNPIFSRESGEAGWNYFVRESLKGFLEQQSEAE